MGRKTVYNRDLVTSEKWDFVCDDNKELMREFLDYLGSIGRSKETISQYENDLKIFFCWYAPKFKNKHFTEIKKREVTNFQGFLLKDCGMSSNRIRRMRSSLSSLSNFIESVLDDEYEDFRNIINKIPAPDKNTVREKTIITFNECIEVADRLIEDGNYQLACYLTVACYSGLRKQELTRLLYKDFTDNINMEFGGSFYRTTPIRVKGRGNKTKEKYVWNKCDKWLNLWIQYRKENNIDCEYLFCRKDGNGGYKQMAVATANSFANTLSRYFGKDYYNHCTRHTLATELTRAGLPVDAVQILLDHQSAETSKLYIDISDTENMEKFSDFFSGKADSVDKKGVGDL
ncbi:MAG: tyrosine-type recombinase/integrase [Clostridium chrysemydis]|uniref:tyrosine-type recombinase/integrase n=1 Tax=Clostridium chrysemydis TaxID=2665504 RepID=UPI003F332489